jgi:hypothetical protein
MDAQWPNIVTALVVLLPVALIVTLLKIIDRRRAWRLAEVGRQIAVTDAIHAELGAVVAPIVRRRSGNRWRLEIAVPFHNLEMVTRVVESASRAFDVDERAEPGRFELVLSPQERPVRHSARAAATARPTRGESVSWI